MTGVWAKTQKGVVFHYFENGESLCNNCKVIEGSLKMFNDYGTKCLQCQKKLGLIDKQIKRIYIDVDKKLFVWLKINDIDVQGICHDFLKKYKEERCTIEDN